MNESSILAGVACNLDIDLINACLTLFQNDSIEVVEWSFDALHQLKEIPFWFKDLIQDFSNADRLLGHGIYFSIFSGQWSKEQQNWLKTLHAKCQEYNFSHISEHFGFMSGANFHNGAPLPVPFNEVVCQIGIDRLKRIQNVCECPVGLENLALSLNSEDVKRQGEFLNQLIEPVNGFIILDLHNIYCQLHNFGIEIDSILAYYPLDRVREIHISGGSWQHSSTNPSKRIRRDTHDHAVPNEVFELLSYTIPYCPNLKYVILEQLGRSLGAEQHKSQFQKDFCKMSEIVKKGIVKIPHQKKGFLPEQQSFLPEIPQEDIGLHLQQLELSNILENALNVKNAKDLLSISKYLSKSDWKVENWDDDMIETAIKIAQKWKKGFRGPQSYSS